jgi:hypothetical protein
MNVLVDPPIAIIETKYITSYTYQLYNFVLNQEVSIMIDYFCLLGSSPRPIYQSIITLKGEQYNAWGQDDSYIQNIVLADVEKVRNGDITPPTVDGSV